MNIDRSSPRPAEVNVRRLRIRHPILLGLQSPQGAFSIGDRPSFVSKSGTAKPAVQPVTLSPPRALRIPNNTEILTRQDLEGAKALWRKPADDTDGDGIRDKDGEKLALLVPELDQRCAAGFQALIKGAGGNQIGVESSCATLISSVFFRWWTPGSPDTSRSSMPT